MAQQQSRRKSNRKIPRFPIFLSPPWPFVGILTLHLDNCGGPKADYGYEHSDFFTLSPIPQAQSFLTPAEEYVTPFAMWF